MLQGTSMHRKTTRNTILVLISSFLFILTGCSSSIVNAITYTVAASWNSYISGAGLETVETSSTTTNKVFAADVPTFSSTSSVQIAGQVTKYVTEAGALDTDSTTRFIVGYTHKPDKQLPQATLKNIHDKEDVFMGGMSIARLNRNSDHPMEKSASFDTFHIPSEVLESYGNDYEKIVDAINENFFNNGGTGNEVTYVEPDYSMQAFSSEPDDPKYSSQWNMQNSYMNIPKLHGITSGDSDVIVAVIDTGVYEDGVDFDTDTFVTGYNFCTTTSIGHNSSTETDTTDTTDDNGHGTHVTGTIAETTNNAIGVASIAPGIKIMPLKALDSEGSGYTSDICDAIRYAVDNGAVIINMSLGSSSSSTTLENACTYAEANGVLIVAAAGNENTDTKEYPAAYDSVLSVGAVGYDTSVRASYSNYCDWVDVMAYGGEDGYFTVDGTEYYDGILQWTISDSSNGNGYYILEPRWPLPMSLPWPPCCFQKTRPALLEQLPTSSARQQANTTIQPPLMNWESMVSLTPWQPCSIPLPKRYRIRQAYRLPMMRPKPQAGRFPQVRESYTFPSILMTSQLFRCPSLTRMAIQWRVPTDRK